MKPSTVWIAIVLLALGVCGLLGAAGVIDSSQVIGQWWPLAVVGWAALEMLVLRRVTLGSVIVIAIGLTLLADSQSWASDALAWSTLAITVGLAILVDAGLRREDSPSGGDTRAALGGGPS